MQLYNPNCDFASPVLAWTSLYIAIIKLKRNTQKFLIWLLDRYIDILMTRHPLLF